MDKNLSYYDQLEAFRQPGCSICRLVERHSREYLETIFYESVNDPEIRLQLRNAFGFCAAHAMKAAEIGSPLAIALIYEDILNALDQEIGRAIRNGRVGMKGKCPFCEQEHQMEIRLTRALAASIEEEAMQTAFKSSEGLCARHLIKLLSATSPDIRQFVGESERGKIRALRAELKELIRKNDYRFAKETIGEEGDSWLRALRKTAGHFIERKGKSLTG